MILFIIGENNEVHPVVFHSWTFTSTKFNYNIYNKKLLAIFEAFKFSTTILRICSFLLTLL